MSNGFSRWLREFSPHTAPVLPGGTYRSGLNKATMLLILTVPLFFLSPAYATPPPVDTDGDGIADAHDEAPNDPQAPGVGIPAVYLQDSDNENNAHTGSADKDIGKGIQKSDSNHPIELNIYVDKAKPFTSAYLSVFINDVDFDFDKGEWDEIFLNGHSLGLAMGENDLDYSTLFLIPDPSWVQLGDNLVEVYVDQNPKSNINWAATLERAELVVDPAPQDAFVRTLTTSKPGYDYNTQVTVSLEVDTKLASQDVVIEGILRDAKGSVIHFDNNSSAKKWHLTGTNDEPYQWNISLPSSGNDGVWAVTITVYDKQTYLFQDMKTVTFNVPDRGSIPPVVKGIKPSVSAIGKSSPITISGTNFVSGATTCTIGGLPVINLKVVNNTTISGNSDSSLKGDVQHDVICTTDGGTSTLGEAFKVILSTTKSSTSSFTLNWTDFVGASGYLIMCNVANIFTAPVDGTAQTDDTDCSDGGGKNIAQGVGTYTWTGLNPSTPYFFRIYPYSNSGTNIAYKIDGAMSVASKSVKIMSSATVSGPGNTLTNAARKDIKLGLYHSCLLTTAGGVKCWGMNNFGQLGNGSTTDRHQPVAVSGLSHGVSAVALGGAHSCALTTTGGVKCWGQNNFGQLGDGSTTNRHHPVVVSGLSSDVSAIALGAWHSCALMTTGGVKCWGWNNYGQLGDGSTTVRLQPMVVSDLSGVRAIAVGATHSCVLMTTGGVKCWGSNEFGELGDDSNTNQHRPVAVSGLSSGVSTIALGIYYSCALMTTGGVKCWGQNNNGQLGDGSTTKRHQPVTVSGLSGVRAIAVGGSHSCALTTTGGVKCWGQNHKGQLGDGSTINRYQPVTVSGLNNNVSAIRSGGMLSCALMTTGAVKCWGQNDKGQFGDGSTTNRNIPIDVQLGDGEKRLVPKPEKKAPNEAHTMKNGAHIINLVSGQTMNNINFGNTRVPPPPPPLPEHGTGIIQGQKWNDLNGDGKIDVGEPGLAGVIIYLDLNDDGVLGKNEPYQITNEQGHYIFSNLKAATYVVREQVPDGYRQTYPPVHPPVRIVY